MTAVQSMFCQEDGWKLGKLRTCCCSPAVNEHLNQYRKTLYVGLLKCKYVETFCVEFHRAHVWIVVIFHFVSDMWHSLNYALVWCRPISLLLFCINGIFSLSQGHQSAYVVKISCCFLSASPRCSHSQISLGIQDHMTSIFRYVF